MKPDIIIDNTALGYFSELNAILQKQGYSQFDIFRLIPMLFSVLHVPMKVKDEFAYKIGDYPHRAPILNRIESSDRILRLCQTFDQFTTALIQTDKPESIDAGEAEAIAQAYQIQVYWFLTDEKRCLEYVGIRFPMLRCITSLFVLAALDVHEYLTLPREVVFAAFWSLHQRPPKKTSIATVMKNVYNDVARNYGLTFTNKELSQRTSTKGFGV
jgi:hypothetical protein